MKYIALLFLLGGCAHTYYVHDIPNYRIVDDKVLFRGGEPKPGGEGWAYLKSLGVKTVIKLNYEAEGSDNEALALGLNVLKSEMPPSDFGDFLQTPSLDQIHAAVTAMLNPNNFPVYVHCSHGQDRTGLVTAMFRVIHDHWTFEDARNEMISNGYHVELHGLEEAWERFKKALSMPPNVTVPNM